MSGISILILTKNEQQDLPGCLETMRWSDDVHVFDSMSTDRTLDVAERYGAKVTQRVYDNESTHKNWGLAHIPFKHDWVYQSDADERLTPELIEAMRQAVRNAGQHVAFRVRRRDYLFGTWLQHVTPSPFNIRLFKPASIRHERLTNPVTLVDGPVGELNEHFNHLPFSKGIAFWFEKHNWYSTLEARQIIANRDEQPPFSIIKALTARDLNVRRFNQKELYYRLPCRPLVMFLVLYVGKRGFLDGRSGFIYAVLRAIYEYMIILKVREHTDKP
jgi:glycosyltransferase involved in cell wall biosynthesis